MKISRMLLRASGLFAVLALALSVFLPAQAKAPTTEDWIFSAYGTFDCGDFIIDDTFDVDVTITYYWNKDGSMDRYRMHGEITDRMVNPNNGKEVFGRTHGYNFFEDVENTPGVWKHAGLMFHVVEPGQGVLNIDAGLFYMVDGQNGEMHGKHEFNTYQFTELCAALR